MSLTDLQERAMRHTLTLLDKAEADLVTACNNDVLHLEKRPLGAIYNIGTPGNILYTTLAEARAWMRDIIDDATD